MRGYPGTTPEGDSVVDAVTNYRNTMFIGLYVNAVDPDLVDGLVLSDGAGANGSGSGSGSGSVSTPIHPLIEVPTGSIPGYQRAYPSDWRQTIATGLIHLRGHATFRTSATPASPVNAYGWFAAIPVQESGVALVGFEPFAEPVPISSEGQFLIAPLDLVVYQPDPSVGAQVSVAGDGLVFGGSFAGRKITTDVHTRSDLEFVRFLFRALKRIPGHDARALQVHSPAARTSPIPIVDPNDKDMMVSLGKLQNRLSELHTLWTGRNLN